MRDETMIFSFSFLFWIIYLFFLTCLLSFVLGLSYIEGVHSLWWTSHGDWMEKGDFVMYISVLGDLILDILMAGVHPIRRFGSISHNRLGYYHYNYLYCFQGKSDAALSNNNLGRTTGAIGNVASLGPTDILQAILSRLALSLSLVRPHSFLQSVSPENLNLSTAAYFGSPDRPEGAPHFSIFLASVGGFLASLSLPPPSGCP